MNEEYAKEHFKKADPEWWLPEAASNDRRFSQIDRDLFVRERLDVISLVEPKGKIILDCGTGQGRIALDLAKAGAKSVTGIDISEEMLKIARQSAEKEKVQDRTSFEQGEAENLINYPDDYFDAAICIQTLQHLLNPAKCVDELIRVTKAGGIIVVDHMNKNPIWRIRVRGWRDFLFAGILVELYFSVIGSPLRYLLHKLRGYPMISLVRRVSEQQFLNLIARPQLLILDTSKYGPKYCPVYFIIKAMKK